jgi:hypothetical protein
MRAMLVGTLPFLGRKHTVPVMQIPVHSNSGICIAQQKSALPSRNLQSGVIASQ